jgi:hypothetical protein
LARIMPSRKSTLGNRHGDASPGGEGVGSGLASHHRRMRFM